MSGLDERLGAQCVVSATLQQLIRFLVGVERGGEAARRKGTRGGLSFCRIGAGAGAGSRRAQRLL
jgi:hypothetical protein